MKHALRSKYVCWHSTRSISSANPTWKMIGPESKAKICTRSEEALCRLRLLLLQLGLGNFLFQHCLGNILPLNFAGRSLRHHVCEENLSALLALRFQDERGKNKMYLLRQLEFCHLLNKPSPQLFLT
jgi:hypothetical protein